MYFNYVLVLLDIQIQANWVLYEEFQDYAFFYVEAHIDMRWFDAEAQQYTMFWFMDS